LRSVGARALEQPQPVLELSHAKFELGDRVTRGDAELRAEAGAHRAGGFTQPLELAAPALEDVDEDDAGLVRVDSKTSSELFREIVHPVCSQREDADPGERECLERAPGRLQPRSGRL